MLLCIFRAPGHHILLLPLHVPGDPAHQQVRDRSLGGMTDNKGADFNNE